MAGTHQAEQPKNAEIESYFGNSPIQRHFFCLLRIGNSVGVSA